MDARLKQRLVGAAVLLALIVIVVPMFFSAHEQGGSATTSVSLGIPAQPQLPVQSKTFALGAPAAATSVRSDSASTGIAASAAVAPVGAGLPTVTIPGAPANAGSASLPSPAPGVKEHASRTAGLAVASTARVARPATTTATPNSPRSHTTVPVLAPAVADRAVPLPAGTAAEVAYLVSLGAYTDLGSARALAARVRQLGVPVGEQSLRLGGRPAIRVYAGPYANRSLAEAARLRIHVAEPHATAVVLEQRSTLSTDQAAQALPAGQPGGWVVQLGAFDTATAATTLVQHARAAGFPAYSDRLVLAGGTLWRVRVGPESSRDRAVSLRAQLKAKLGLDGIIAVAR